MFMSTDVWLDLARGRRFITDIGKSIYEIDSLEAPRAVGRYAVWYPIPENIEKQNNQTHQIIEISDDLEVLLFKHSIPFSMVYKLVNSPE
jgi:hypothetical protein